MLNEYLLEMHHINKIYPGVVALDDVSFKLKAGMVHVLLGENGAGKSTLIKIISGATLKSQGLIILDNEEVDILNPREALDLGVATIYQELNLVPQLTVAENIYLGREPVTKSGLIDQKRMMQDVTEILNSLGANIPPESKVSSLGIARQQMVEIAKAISIQMKILILDEPTSALSHHEIEQLFSVIRKLKENGIGIIYISHRLEEIFEIGDCVTVLRDGKVMGNFPVESVKLSELIRLMADREVHDHFPKQEAKPGAEILQVEHISRKGILHDISFSLHKGEILGISGLMGSGRTELARVLFGVEKADTGTIFLNKKEVRIDSPREAIQNRIAYLSEDRKVQGLILKMSLENNISLPGIKGITVIGIIRKEAEHRLAGRYVNELHIKATGLDQLAESLSGGNQQKVVIAKWLVCQSDIFIFDEPTRGIDVAAKVEIYHLMNQLTARGAAIIMISSELPEIMGMSDRILVISYGRIAGEFLPKYCSQENLLECALGVDHAVN